MTDKLIERLASVQKDYERAGLHGENGAQIMKDAQVCIEAYTEVINAIGPLVQRLKALQTYFDLSDEELESMTRDERADTIRQHRMISDALAAFRQAQDRAALEEKNDE